MADVARSRAFMNVEHTNDRSPSGELHQPNDLFDVPALPRTFFRVFDTKRQTDFMFFTASIQREWFALRAED